MEEKYCTIPSHDKAYMTKTISESYNPYDNGVINEGLMTFNMADLADYVMHEDKRLSTLCESIGFDIYDDYSNVDIDRYNKIMSIKEGNDTLKLFLKNSVVNNMDNYFRYRF